MYIKQACCFIRSQQELHWSPAAHSTVTAIAHVGILMHRVCETPHIQYVSLWQYHVDVLILVEPFAWHPGVKSQERECTEDVFIQLQVVAVYVMRHLHSHA